jgi:hypothetical protein
MLIHEFTENMKKAIAAALAKKLLDVVEIRDGWSTTQTKLRILCDVPQVNEISVEISTTEIF